MKKANQISLRGMMSILGELHLLFYGISERQDAIINGSKLLQASILNGVSKVRKRGASM
ncbi:hypothetical protein [Peribacillus simplex]|uniref:hypothetical protein n=1 Tax=Peribacillus simplex TaxID=1478 RepID=UPI003D03EC09